MAKSNVKKARKELVLQRLSMLELSLQDTRKDFRTQRREKVVNLFTYQSRRLAMEYVVFNLDQMEGFTFQQEERIEALL